MRLLIISDIHANPWALRAIQKEAGAVDRVLCAGDVVSYGPDPRAVIAWLRDHNAAAVRGNHDHAVAFNADPKAAPAKRIAALAMRDWTRSVLGPNALAWLVALPRQLNREIGGTSFMLTHATPRDPLYDYHLTPDIADDALGEMVQGVDADVLVLGHTHLPLLRRHGTLQIVNPGSAGQPLDHDPRAAYAIWEDGELTLRRAAYDQSELLEAVRKLPMERDIIEDLVRMLQSASTN
jgi:putative phosphoesterase